MIKHVGFSSGVYPLGVHRPNQPSSFLTQNPPAKDSVSFTHQNVQTPRFEGNTKGKADQKNKLPPKAESQSHAADKTQNSQKPHTSSTSTASTKSATGVKPRGRDWLDDLDRSGELTTPTDSSPDDDSDVGYIAKAMKKRSLPDKAQSIM
jgi:hypothetical protein